MSESESPSERRAARQAMPKKKRVLLASIAAGTAVVLLGAGLLAWQLTSAGAKPDATSTKKPLPSPTAFATPAPGEPVALSLDAPASDEFDWWAVESPDSRVKFLASDEAHDGGYSAGIVSTLPHGSGLTPHLYQQVSAVAGRTYSVELWVKSAGAESGAMRLIVGDGSVQLPVPEGAYDWTQISSEYRVPDGQGAIALRIVVDGPSTGTFIDSIAVSEIGGGSQPVMNAGFESNSSDLIITNTTLLLTEGEAEIAVSSRRSPTGWFQWSASGLDDVVLAEGESLIEESVGKADLSALPVGMYKFAVRAMVGGATTERQTTFAVVDAFVPDADASKSPFGVFLHYLGGESRLSNMVDSLAIAGVRHARVEMTWPAIEREQGVYTFDGEIESTLQKFGTVGITPLMVPVYGNGAYDGGRTPSSEEGLEAYARFASALASHYAPVGQDFEVYNEFDHIFNSGNCGPTPSCYIDMISETAETVKASNPNAVIVGPGNAGMGFKLDWLSEFFALGGLEYADVVSAHPYTQPDAPEKLVNDLRKLSQMIKDGNGGVPKPIWLTEMGWASVPDWVTKEQQADYLVRTMALALGNGAERVYWFEAASLNLNEADIESNFGLFDAPSSFLPNTNAPKLAAVAQAVMARQLEGRSFTGIDSTPDSVYSYAFGKGENATRVMWTPTDAVSVQVASSSPLRVTNILGTVETLKPTKGIVTLEVSGSPLYVEGAVTSVSK